MDTIETIQAALRPFQEQMRARSLVYAPGDGYWYHRPALDFPPSTVRDPSDYGGGERLSLAITQTALKPPQQKALVREWCALLPTLGNVRTLWFHTKVTQEMFEAACAMPALEGLYIKWSAITSLAPLAGHPRLAHLHLGGAPSATHVEALAQLPALVTLDIANVRAAGDLGFLQGLPRLRELSISGDANSLKPLVIESLAPLAGHARLAHLHLGGAPSATHVEALAQLPALVTLDIANVRAAGDLRFLQGLPRLRELSISGDANSLKPLVLESLAPLAALLELEQLNLTVVRLADGSLAPLAGLPKLRHLGLGNMFTMEEYARLAGLRPDIQCDRFAPSYGPNESLRCKTCRQHGLFALTGKGKPWLCQHCDAAKLARHDAEFMALVKAAAAGPSAAPAAVAGNIR